MAAQADKVMINLKEALRSAPGGADTMKRINGGWCKQVTGLNKAVDNGHSIKGDLVARTDSNAYQMPGLYLDCDIAGKNKNREKFYTLFVLSPDGAVEILGEADRRHSADWAVKLWPEIEEYFNGQKAIEEALAALPPEPPAIRITVSKLADETLNPWYAQIKHSGPTWHLTRETVEDAVATAARMALKAVSGNATITIQVTREEGDNS